MKVYSQAASDVIPAFVGENQAVLFPVRLEQLAFDTAKQAADFKNVFEPRAEAHCERKLQWFVPEVLNVELFVHDALLCVNDPFPFEPNRLPVNGLAVRCPKIRCRQLKNRPASLPRARSQRFRMFASYGQIIAVQKSAVVIVETEAMVACHRHFAARRRQKI